MTLLTAIVVFDYPIATYKVSSLSSYTLHVVVNNTQSIVIEGNGATLYVTTDCFAIVNSCTSLLTFTGSVAGSGTSVQINNLTIDGWHPGFMQGYATNAFTVGAGNLTIQATAAVPDPTFATIKHMFLAESKRQLFAGFRNMFIVLDYSQHVARRLINIQRVWLYLSRE